MADVNFFKNKTVLVTGGCTGLSKAIAIELIMNKTDVVLIASKKEEIAAINNELSGTKKKIGKFIGVIGDTSSSKTTDDLVRSIRRAAGKVDILINNAAELVPGKFDEQGNMVIESMINKNVTGTMLLTKAIIPILKDQKKPGMINIFSYFGRVGVPYFTAFSAAQHAVAGFAEALQREYATENFRIMNVCTAGLDTDMYKGLVSKMAKLGYTFDKPEDIAKAIIDGYNAQKTELVFGKQEKSMAYWGRAGAKGNDNKFKKIKTRLLNIIAGFGNDE